MKKRRLMMVFGAGYLGEYLARTAREQGWTLWGLTRNEERARHLEGKAFDRVIPARLDSDIWWEWVTEAPDLVVNCVSSAGGGLEGYQQSYVQGNKSILGWGRQHPDRDGLSRATFLYTGSTGVYPDAGGAWLGEGDVGEGEEDRAGILRTAEMLIQREAPEVFGRWFVLRLAGLYGPARSFLIKQLREGGVRGTGDTFLNLIRVEDAAAAILACASAPGPVRDRIFNVSDGNPALKGDIVNWLGAQMGMAPPYFDSSPAGSWRGTRNRRIDSTAIREVLGWRPRYANYREGFYDLLQQ